MVPATSAGSPSRSSAATIVAVRDRRVRAHVARRRRRRGREPAEGSARDARQRARRTAVPVRARRRRGSATASACCPRKPGGYYHEYTVRTPGERTRGARRIVCGGTPTAPDACWYTGDHYGSFARIVEWKVPDLSSVDDCGVQEWKGATGAAQGRGSARGLKHARSTSAKAKDKATLFAELDRALALPDHFGHNWDALADVLEDRDWLGKTRAASSCSRTSRTTARTIRPTRACSRRSSARRPSSGRSGMSRSGCSC